MQRNFTARGVDEVWLTDITEHPTLEGELYVCAIKDLCSNRIVGYAIDERMTAQLAVSALRSAIARRQPHGTVVVHSVRGSAPIPRHSRRADRREVHRLDGASRRRGRQRRDGVLLLAATEERPRPGAAEEPVASCATRSSPGSSTPTTDADVNASSASSPRSITSSPSPARRHLAA